MIEVYLQGIRLKSSNETLRAASRKARFGQAKTARNQRGSAVLMLNSEHGPRPPAPPLVITVTRFSPGKLDGHDNLPSSAKHVVDGVAEWLKLDDRDPRLTWRYSQERSRDYGVGIRIEEP